jgi:DnaJ-class molecular chaperone
MTDRRDYYEILGVERSANQEQIRKAYRKLARQFHPDVNKEADAAKKFSEVQEAYDVISDDEKRKNYDRFGHTGVAGFGGPGASHPGAGHGRAARGPSGWTNVGGQGVEAEDLGEIFEQMFGGGRGSPFGAGFGGPGGRSAGAASRAHAQPQRGVDQEHSITVTFLTAALGGTEHIRIGADGSASTISVKIPPGIESGAKLRVRGKGSAGRAGGSAGDLLLSVQVGSHPYFRREGLDIIVDVPITIAEAVLGVKVTVPLLPVDGRTSTVEIKIPSGTSSGARLRVKSKGITDAKGRSGDYYAVVGITAPAVSGLSQEEVQAMEKITQRLPNPRENAPWAGEIG